MNGALVPSSLAAVGLVPLLAAVALAILFLYFLRPPARRLRVPGLLLWSRLGAGTRRRRHGLRWFVSLLLALSVGGALALVTLRPEIRALGWSTTRVVLVMDDSPSLAARTGDGGTRWDHAVRKARAVMSAVGEASEFIVLDTMGSAGVPTWLPRKRALERIAQLAPASHGAARLPPLPGGAVRTVFITDEVAPIALPAGVLVESVYQPVANVAVSAFELRASERTPERIEAFVQIRNHGAAPQDVRLRIAPTDAAGEAVERRWSIEPGGVHEDVVDVSMLRPGIVAARASANGDGYAQDDVAWAVIPAHSRRRVLLVGNGDPALTEALRLLPGVELRSVATAAFREPAAADFCVFDRFAPVLPPACPALHFRAPLTAWLPPATIAPGRATVTRWKDDDALASSIAWNDLQLDHVQLASVPDDATAPATLVHARAGREGALVAASDQGARWIDVGFAVHDSNLAFASGFPVFLAESLRWLGAGPEVVHRNPGVVALAPLHGEVRDMAGRPVELRLSAAGTSFVSDRSGVYEVRDGKRIAYVVVNESDPDFGAINRRALRRSPPADGAVAVPMPLRLPMQPWMLALLGVLSVLVFEWMAFCRRWTE